MKEPSPTQVANRSSFNTLGDLSALGSAPSSGQTRAPASKPALTAEHRHKLLVEWNRTERSFPQDKSVHQLFEAQANRTPEAIAVAFEGQTLTYRELDRRANQLAQRLLKLGTRPDRIVALFLERSVEMVVAIYGTLKAGAAYLPIDPDYPSERVAFMLQDAEPVALLTHPAARSKLPSVSLPVLDLENDWAELGRESDEPPVAQVMAEHLAYVIYTSGTTGRPKGVMNTHRGLVNRLLWMQEAYRLTAMDAVLQKTPYTFDVSVWEFCWPLLTGARLIVARPAGHRDADYLVRIINQAHVTTLHFVPSMLIEFLRHPKVSECVPLRRVFSSGEALPVGTQETFFECLPLVELHNLYGPTEAAIDVTHWRCHSEPGLRNVPIGRPIANTQIYLLDEQLQPVPVGQAGELHIGGIGVARGYLKRPELTAERFIPDPFRSDPGARLYKTGDLACHRPDGVIEYLGRMDHQVKIRGNRIELGEIETVLGRHPSVSACAVIAPIEPRGERTLAAFVVLHPNAAVTQPALRSWLEQRLPAYMIPSRCERLDALPTTPNGKLDRKALEQCQGTPLPLGTEYQAPRNELERQLAEIWQEVLRRPHVGIHDHFLDLGGHSLLAYAVITRCRARLGREVWLRWIYEHPTVAGLARKIEAARPGPDTHSIQAADRRQPLPMSFDQERVWLLQQTLPAPAAYNEPAAYRLQGSLDAGRLKACFQTLLERHEALRTALVWEEGEMRQQIWPANRAELPWEVVDLRELPPAQQTSAMAEHCRNEARYPYDLARAPLWRVRWLILGKDDYLLLLTFHHSIVDEWSWRLFLGELAALYAAGENQGHAGLPELTVHYADFAVWQRQQLAGQRLESARTYWAEQTKDWPPPLELLGDYPRPARPTGRGDLYRFALAGELTARLRELARTEQCSLFHLMLAAYQVWLHRYTGLPEVTVGTPIAHRDRLEFEKVMGFFLNTLPIRTRIQAGDDFRSVLRQVRGTFMEAVDHSHLPFEQIAELARHKPPTQPGSLFQVMFVLVETGAGGWQLGGVRPQPLPVHTGTSKSDLTLSITAEGETWLCDLEYPEDLFTAASAARMAGHFEELLRSILANPAQPVGRLNLVPLAERRLLLEEWNRTGREYPRDQSVSALFVEQAMRTPDAVAVVFQAQSLTYRELNERSNQWARRLRQLGMRPGSVVALAVDRSIEFAVAVLGILKGGGVYLPLPALCPPDRLRFMLADSGAVGVICDRPWLDVEPQPALSFVCELRLEAPAFAACSKENLDDGRTGGELAYVMYTSGSTGEPRAVGIPHRGIGRLVRGQQYAPFDDRQRFLLASSTAFDAATFELWGPLLCGATCVIFPPGPPDLKALERILREQRITVLWLTVGLFNQIIDQQPSILATVPHVLTGGDALSVPHVLRALEALPALRLTNGYGPTESTTFACTHALVRGERFAHGTVPIGRPIANTRCYILNEQGSLAPIGVAGELCLGGDGLACGYLNRPELNAQKFIADPFREDTQARLYRTGDQARWLADGTIEFLGRRDRQVKIRGFRIELGEIESVLKAHPEVHSCAVIASAGEPGEKNLAAFLVLRKGATVAVHSLRAWLSEKLPDYMLPSRMAVLEALPLTPNGKVDRRALEKLEGTALALGTDYLAPRNELERQLVAIWQDILERKQVGVLDDFFNSGGSSLRAVRVLAEVRRRLGKDLPLAAIYHGPTVAQLGDLLREDGQLRMAQFSAAFRGRSEGVPVFHIPGYQGYGALPESVAQRLGAVRPYYSALQFPDFTHESTANQSIETIAAHLLEQIVAVYPQGPCCLCGHSFGGVLAYELACQMRAQNREVETVFLWDAANVQCQGRRLTLAETLAHAWRRSRQDGVFRLVRRRLAARLFVTPWLRFWKKQQTEAGNQPAEYLLVEFAAHRMAQYHPQPYPGKVVLFRAGQEPQSLWHAPFPLDMGWGALIPNLEIITLPCSHMTMIEEPAITILAEAMCQRLPANRVLVNERQALQ